MNPSGLSRALRTGTDPPTGPFDSERVDASDYAYKRLETPDGLLMIGTYAVTAALAGAGAPDRARQRPWLPLALATKAAFNVATNARLAREEWKENDALCAYCQAANVASLAIAALCLSEASRAARHLLGDSDLSLRPPKGEPRRKPTTETYEEDLLEEALEDTFPASDPPDYIGAPLPKTAMQTPR